MATRVKEKAAARQANADKRPRATAKYVRVAPRKAKIVVDLIRGKQVDDALAILMYTPKSAAPVVEKLLNSAIANAENNHGAKGAADLTVKLCVLEESVRMRRYWPTARGSAHPIARRLCHCRVVLAESKKSKKGAK